MRCTVWKSFHGRSCSFSLFVRTKSGAFMSSDCNSPRIFICYRVYTKQKSSSSSFCYFDDDEGLAYIQVNSESAVYTYSTNSEFKFKNWSSISGMYAVKDCTFEV